MLEAYTTLGFLAARTERVRLGTMVTAVTFRPPALLVKAVTTLDVLSGGRAWLGLGAGYHAAEAAAMGLPLPPIGERFERLEETLRIARQLWAGDATPFRGRALPARAPAHSPAPLVGRARRSSSAAPASAARCRWSPATPTPATCSTSPTAAPPPATSSACCSEPARRDRPALRRDREDDLDAPRARRVGRRPSSSAAGRSPSSASTTWAS